MRLLTALNNMTTPRTVSAVIATLPPRTYASRAGYKAAVFRACVRLTGCEPLTAKDTPGGACVVCGEDGRCTRLHFLAEFVPLLAAQ